MANHASAKKRARQTIVKTERNKAHKSKSKTLIKTLRTAIESNEKQVAVELLQKVQSHLGKMAKLGVYKKNNVARRTSRLSLAVNKMA